jgi:hypothetical protein
MQDHRRLARKLHEEKKDVPFLKKRTKKLLLLGFGGCMTKTV